MCCGTAVDCEFAANSVCCKLYLITQKRCGNFQTATLGGGGLFQRSQTLKGKGMQRFVLRLVAAHSVLSFSTNAWKLPMGQ